jgi:hypothetical protein
MSRTPRRIALFVAAVVIWTFVWSAPARAQNGTWFWTGNSATSSDWSDPANWEGGVPPNDGTAWVVFRGTPPRLTPTHGPYAIHFLTFYPGSDTGGTGPAAGPFEILATGPLTFRRDPAQQFSPEPLIANDSSKPNTLRGDFIVWPDATLTIRANQFGGPPGEPSNALVLGNTTGSRINGGAAGRGGGLALDSTALTFMLDNAATSPADRGMYLRSAANDPSVGSLANARINVVAADPNYTGTGASIDVSEFRDAAIILKFQDAGADGNSVGLAPTNLVNTAFVIRGDERAAGIARTGARAPRLVLNGITAGGFSTHGNVTISGNGNAALEGLTGIRVEEGTATLGSADPDPSKTFRVQGPTSAAGPTATVVFDPTLGATGDVTSRKLEIAGGLSVLVDATAVFRSSAHVTSGPAISFDGTINGTGTVKLELGGGTGGIAFSPATQVMVGTQFGPGALRFEGPRQSLDNLFTPERLSAVTGSGTLEIAATDNQPFDLRGGAWSNPQLALKVTDSNPTGLDARLNAAGGTRFAGGVLLERGSTFDVAGNRLGSSGAGVIQGVGTLIGPAAYDGQIIPGPASQGGITLTGDSTGLSWLLIRTNLDQGPLEYGQLHATDDLALLSADGVPTRLNATSPGGGTFNQQLTIVSLDAGATLTGQFEGLPDGARIHSFNAYDYIIHYNVDGGDGSANDVTLTLVPEPASLALLALAATALLTRRRSGVTRAAPQ